MEKTIHTLKERSHTIHSDEIRSIAQKLKTEGKSYAEIGKLINLSKDSVVSLVKYKRKAHKKKTGRKSIINDREKMKIKKFINEENRIGNKVTCNVILENLNLDLSRRTLNNFLLRTDAKYTKHPQKIILSQEHKNKRMEAIKLWIKGNIDWTKVVFTDEKRFSLDGPDNWHTWTYSKEIIKRYRRHSEGGGIMVWGMVMANGLIAIKIVTGGFKAENYKNLMDAYALPLMRLNYQNVIMVQDNARPHVSKVMLKHFKDENIELINWPARSPDLNLMETVWSMLSQDVYSLNQPKNKTDLETRIFSAVNRMNEERRYTIQSLFEGFTDRIFDVIQRKGDLLN